MFYHIRAGVACTVRLISEINFDIGLTDRWCPVSGCALSMTMGPFVHRSR